MEGVLNLVYCRSCPNKFCFSRARTGVRWRRYFPKGAMSRRMRAFKRWMKWQGVECSDALNLIHGGGDEEVSVRALCDLKEGDVVATIPKQSCLTVKTTGARDLIDEFGLKGYMGLSVAVMYEQSLGQLSPWFGYLQLLPHSEPIPLLWSVQEIDSLLSGTELHKTIKEDKALVHQDWKECILPLLDLASASVELNPTYFGVEHYFAAKSLIASRSFEIDDYHGFGMVPLADLFNHKTGAEDVHFTLSTQFESSVETCDSVEYETDVDDSCGPSLKKKICSQDSPSVSEDISSSTMADDSAVLEMIIVKDVKAGAEVFNTYGSLGNAALLHRYGFAEADNPYDIVNIDLELVVKWSLSLFSSRESRRRISLWRRLGYCGCESQESEYFEVAFDGQPQVELLILLYLILAPEEVYQELYLKVPAEGNVQSFGTSSSIIEAILSGEVPESSKNILLTKNVRRAILSLAEIRENLYGCTSLEDDVESLKSCQAREKKVYHSLILRISERRILEKLRSYASAGAGTSGKPPKLELSRSNGIMGFSADDQ